MQHENSMPSWGLHRCPRSVQHSMLWPAAMITAARGLQGGLAAQGGHPRHLGRLPNPAQRKQWLPRSLPVPPPSPAEGEEETKFEQRWGCLPSPPRTALPGGSAWPSVAE